MPCFVDGTTNVEMSGKTHEGVRAVKTLMREWEKYNDDAKEEMLEFRTNEGGSVHVLGSWLSMSADEIMRSKRANCLWWKVKSRLKSSQLTKNWHMRVVGTCLESSLL